MEIIKAKRPIEDLSAMLTVTNVNVNIGGCQCQIDHG